MPDPTQETAVLTDGAQQGPDDGSQQATDQQNAEPIAEPKPEGETSPETTTESTPHLVIRDDEGNVVKAYATAEDAARAFREQEQYFGSQISQRDQRLRELQNEERLERLEAERKAQAEAASQRQSEEELQRLREEAHENPEKLIDLLIERDRYFAQREAELERKLSSKFEDTLARQSPEYKANQALIEELVEQGVTRPNAMKIVAKHVKPAKPPKAAPANEPPRNAVRREGPGAPAQSKQLTTQEAAMYRSMGFNEDFIRNIATDLSKQEA